VRNAERHGREPWHAVFRAFSWGALGAVVFALLGEGLLGWYYNSDLTRPQQLEGVFELPYLFFLAIVVAPIIEESAKAWGLKGVRRHIDELEDGLIYGAAIGLGFSATENLVYEVAALLSDGEDAYWATVIVRTLSGTFLHASATALVGYGYARAVTQQRPMAWVRALPFFVLAVLLHAGFNALAVSNATYALFAIVALSLLLIATLLSRIRALDRGPRERVGGFFNP
jgi:RsiW-degrading membrane proteinase PrsW (M82 family)